ncbi:MAG TPA: hypothetical protein VKR55_26465 [Bradyrhizobium sp.]|uniref:hypothetical protein n=1 Tax=Bradyrhizobium sp. TaxID=376 RepID=UPI002CD0C13A|nr:hypothetical protein [Bradyrhizobium sp.]HLZ05682.1 hypothetical protein [Bradyrhizobium sp.]
MSTTISADYDTANTNGGPYWAMNSTWDVGNLVNGTDFTQSLTMQNSSTPNIGTTISWNFPNTPGGYNVYSYPAVFYGDYAGFPAPATSVTAEQVNNLKTLTLSQNISLSGQTDQYDAMYDGYLTSTPDGDQSTVQHEIEVYAHSPGYVQDWLSNLPQHTFTDAQGMKWIIATQGNIVAFAPADFHDLTNNTIDLKGLLQAAAADGVISGNEYFDGIALGNEPREGSGSMTINSFTVNYDGDHTGTASTGTTGTGTGSTGGSTSGGSSSGSSTSGGTTGTGSGSTASGGTTGTGTGSSSSSGSGTGTAPAVTVAAHSLSVSPGHSVDLGLSVSVPTTGDNVTVNISGLPKYESITDNLDHKTFSGSNITLTADEVNSGLSLASNYKGHGHPTATLTVTATDHTANSSSAAQSIVVKDPLSTGGTTGTSDPASTGSTTHHHTGGTTGTGNPTGTGSTTHAGGTTGIGDPTGTGGTTHAGGTTGTSDPTGTGGTTHHHHHHHHHAGGTTHTGGTTDTDGTAHTSGTTGTAGTTVTAGTAPAGGTQASNPAATASGRDAASNTHHDAGAHLGHDAAIHDLMAYVQHQVQSFEHMWH